MTTTLTSDQAEPVDVATVTRAEVCVVAVADAFRDNGEIIASAFGTIPAIGVRLARHTFSPDLMITDGEAYGTRGTWAVGAPADGETEAWTAFRIIFDLVWHGKRHVMMIPSQLDAYGNANISAVGDDYHRPKVQLLGVRGAPGNSVCHPTSYWVPRHSSRVFVSKVDMVAGVGNDSAAAAGATASRYHDLRFVVTDLAVLDYAVDGRVRLASVHPGVTVDQVQEATGFELAIEGEVPETRLPTSEELRLIREVLDPRSLRDKEVPA